ncbi:MAG TPA: alkaline phosphatase family protein [Anaerolineales bacterium]
MTKPIETAAIFLSLAMTACLMQTSASRTPNAMPTAVPSLAPPSTLAPAPTASPSPSPVPPALVPEFIHIVTVIFENKEYDTVIGNPSMPYFNILATAYTLLNQHYAVAHPSLPNYIALVSGDVQGVTSNCEDCFIPAASIADLVEASGRTWKTYQESMPEPCFLGSTVLYAQKHNPFIYFDSIRLNRERCERSVVPLAQLDSDLAAHDLPNFVFITPNLCNSAHDCPVAQADAWLDSLMDKLSPYLDSTGEPYLVIVTWDEGQGSHSCCGLPEEAGGRVATLLVSPQVRNGFQDETPYTHYSLLKTIAEAWHLTYLGRAAEDSNALITAPWK